MPAKRDPLLTAKGTRYTYAGWARRRSQLHDNQERAAFDRAYPEFFRKMIDRDNQEADRIYERSRKPAARKPGNPPKPRQSRPSAKRPVFGNPPPSVPKKPTGKRFTASQRQQITDALTAQREMERIAKQIRLIEADVNMIQRRGLRGREKEHATATTRLAAARKDMRENLAKQKRALKLLYGKGPGNEAYTYASNKLWTHAREFFG